MQPQLTTKDGTTIPLTDEVYEAIVLLVKDQPEWVEPATSIDDLEAEFSDLFTGGPSIDDLLTERAEDLARENRKLEQFD
ncbi:MAG: hypothetical protein AB7F88_12535 [Pyrinomonadaceae bacterium]